MQLNLGSRLQAIASFVPPGARLADIGSDHGYLPAWLLLNERIEFAIAGEVNRDPARRALQTVEAFGLRQRMEVRLGSGLSVLRPGKADVIAIAGMGGVTIRDILAAGREQLSPVRRLILQPNIAGAELRRWLVENGLRIVDEALIKENAIIYEIIVAEPGQQAALTPLEAELGPILLRRQPELFAERVTARTAELEYIVHQLENAKSPSAQAKRQQLIEAIVEMRGVLR